MTQCFGSGQDLLHDMAMDVSQSKLPALETIGQPLVIKSQLMQHRRLQIVHMHPILHGIESQLI